MIMLFKRFGLGCSVLSSIPNIQTAIKCHNDNHGSLYVKDALKLRIKMLYPTITNVFSPKHRLRNAISYFKSI